MKKTVSSLSAVVLLLAFGYAGDKMSAAHADSQANAVVSYADVSIVKADEGQYTEYNDSTSVLVQLPAVSAAIVKADEAVYTEYNDSTTVL